VFKTSLPKDYNVLKLCW